MFFFEKLQDYLYFIIHKLKTTQWIDIPFHKINLLHLYICIIGVFLFIFAYIKIKYPFWNIQPVYHTYDFWRFFYKNPFQVQRNNANTHTKFFQKNKVKTIEYSTLSENAKDVFIDKLQCYYLLSEDMLFIIKKLQLDTVMNGHDNPSYISFYMDRIYGKTNGANKIDTTNPKKGLEEFEILSEELPVAGMASYPIHLKYKNKSISTAHYWEYMWVNRAYKKKNIQRVLIQTHDCIVRDKYPEIQTSIFKKTNVLCDGVVPIVKYQSYTYKTFYEKCDFPKNVYLTRLYNNYDILHDVLENPKLSLLFDIQLYPNIANIQSQIKKEQIYVYCLKRKNQVISIYFFKETFSLCEFNNTRILRLVASISNSMNTYIHIVGYMYSIHNIMKNVPVKYGVIAIDNISHNHIIVKYLNISKENAVNNAYYSYNYVIPKTPIDPSRVLAIL